MTDQLEVLTELNREQGVAIKRLIGERDDLKRAVDIIVKSSPIKPGEPCPLCGFVRFEATVQPLTTWPSIEERDRMMAAEDS